MKAFKRPNAPHGEPWQVWRPAEGYFGLALGKHGNANLTLFRREPKPAKGKAAIRARIRARHLAFKQQQWSLEKAS